ncbi:MAG TPA: PEP-CTERM sorting domain-containing protein [Opitutaceae bacterium]|nr:PEP-CTERM sorting domain-containing protein [Opitutaceae bacterium]
MNHAHLGSRLDRAVHRCALALVLSFPLIAAAQAQITFSGEVSPAPPEPPAASWDLGTDSLHVGFNTAGSITIEGGATVTSGSGSVGYQISSGTAAATVTGTGSSWSMTSFFQGAGTLTVTDGGAVTSGNGLWITSGAVNVTAGGALTSGADFQLRSASLSVSGSGSSFSTTETLHGMVLADGAADVAQFLVDGGAQATVVGRLWTGSGSGSIGVSGAGSFLDVSAGAIDLGSNGGQGTLYVDDGGQVIAGSVTVGVDAYGSLALDTGAQLTSTGGFYVGGQDEGSVNIWGGSVLNTGAAEIGRASGIGTVTVSGAGSAWNVAGIHIALHTSTGRLTIEDGATVTVGGGTGAVDLPGWGGSTAELRIGNGGVAGTLNAGSVNGPDLGGTAIVRFNHTGATTFAPMLTGGLSVVHEGPGTSALTGANTYTAGTTIAAGTVLANNTTGSALGTGPVSVQLGATLGGNGFVGGETTLQAGARLAPGNSIGTLTFESGLTLDLGTILDFELGATSDLLRITGGDFNVGEATFNFTNLAGYAPGAYTLIDWTGANPVAFMATNFNVGTVSLGTASDYLLWIDGTKLMLTASASAIPEPSTYALVFGIGALGLAARRRRRLAP